MTSEQAKARSRGKANEYGLVKDLHKRGVTDAQRVPLSGALKALPGDVRVESLSLLIEAKVYAALDIDGVQHFKVNLAWLWKILGEARRVGLRHAAVIIRGKNLRRRAVILDYDEYLELLQGYETARNG